MNKNWTFGKKIAAGFAVSSALLLMIGLVAFLSVNSLITTSYSVTHTHKVLERISDLLSNYIDTETGQRGYIITGDELRGLTPPARRNRGGERHRCPTP